MKPTTNVLEFRRKKKEQTEKGNDNVQSDNFEEIEKQNKKRKLKELLERNANNARVIKQLTNKGGSSGGSSS